ILVEGLCRITKANDAREKKAKDGLMKILGRDAGDAEAALSAAEEKLGGGPGSAAAKGESVAVEDVHDLKEKSNGKEKLSSRPVKKPKIILPKKSAEA